jgi:4-hydroxy-3-methylbut-2-enyl diphosphate reductase
VSYSLPSRIAFFYRSNTNRRREVADHLGVPAYLVDGAINIGPAWIVDKLRVGVTAGAPAPKILVDEVINRLNALGMARVTSLDGVPERTTFPLPKGLAGEA